MITDLYIASGLIGSNPSAIGATYATRLVHHTGMCFDRSDVLAVWKIEFGGVVTNNQAEMYAMLEGLRRLPEEFRGTIYSRSQVTLLRVFGNYQWKDIPSWMHMVYQVNRKRLINWSEIKYVLADGHNEHIKALKKACREAGEGFMAQIGANIPSTAELENAL